MTTDDGGNMDNGRFNAPRDLLRAAWRSKVRNKRYIMQPSNMYESPFLKSQFYSHAGVIKRET